MTKLTGRKLLAEFAAMRRTGRKTDFDQERNVGEALATRLPRLIAAAADRVKPGPRKRRVSR